MSEVNAEKSAVRLNEELAKKEFDEKVVEVKSYPTHLMISWGYRCNYDCSFCNQTVHRHTKAPEFAAEMLEKFKDEELVKHLSVLTLLGGEPLVYKQTFDYIDYVRSINKDVKIGLVTNGELIDGQRREKMLEADVSVTISLDAGTAETFEGIRLGGHWDKVLTNIKEYKAEIVKRGLEAKVSTIFGVMATNYKEVPVYFDTMSELGLRDQAEIRFSLYNGFEGCLVPITDKAGYRKALEVYRYLSQFTGRMESIGHVYNRLAWFIREYCREKWWRITPKLDADIVTRIRRCRHPWQGFVVNADGRINLNCCKTKALANLGEINSLLELWNSDMVKAIRKGTAEEVYTPFCTPVCTTMYFRNTPGRVEVVDGWSRFMKKPLTESMTKKRAGKG